MLSKQDRENLLESFKLWPERLAPYGHPEREPDFTIGMEQLGASVRDSMERRHFEPASLRHFLIQVGYWKMPRQLASHQSNVNRNTESDILRTFDMLAQTSEDAKRIEICTGVWGFGKGTKQTRMASAILRFLWPDKYGVIDWRNWAVLSNCEHTFLSEPFLPTIGGSRTDLRSAVYDVPMYLAYLNVLRGILSNLNLERVADVDLALYSYSAEIWPFPRLEESLWFELESKVEESNQKQLPLHKIYETYWKEWEYLENLPLHIQKELKIAFLWRCLDITPKSIMVWDDASYMKVPYHIKHRRDLENLERKISGLSLKQTVNELDAFMWSMRLKGDGYGVIRIRSQNL